MSKGLDIKTISGGNEAYLSFASKFGGPFHQLDFLKLFPEVRVAGIFNRNQELKGCFLYRTGWLKWFSALYTPEFLSHCALIYQSDSSNPSKKLSDHKAVLQEIGRFLIREKKSIVSISFPPSISDMQPFQWLGFKVNPKYTYLLNLTKSEDQLLSSMSPERRTNLKKAQKQNYEIKSFEKKDFQSLLDHTLKKLNRAAYAKAIKKLLHEYANPENAIIEVVYQDSIPVSGIFCIYYNEVAVYLIGAFDPKIGSEGAGSLAMWSSILSCKAHGVHSFDFSGSMVPNIERYFRGFGGELQTYFNITKMSRWLRFSADIFGRKLD